MRVLSVGNLHPPAAGGGYERTWAAVERGLAAAGHGSRVLTTAPVPGRELPAGHADPPEVRRELRWYWRDFAFLRPGPRGRLAIERHDAAVLDRHLAGFRPDVVAWWGMGGMPLGLIDRVRRAGVPAVGMVGDEWMDYGRRVDAWLPRGRSRVGLSRAAHWTFASAWLEARAPRLARTSVISPGVDPAAFPAQPQRAWRWRLACVGRVEPPKGIATAIAALAPEATLTVRGDGDPVHRAELAALAAERGAADRVAFEPAAAGPVLEAYAAADAILFPVTWAEPWGLVPLEAMSAGRPVIATGTGGSAEYLRDGVNALVVAPGDAAALRAAVARLAADPGLRARLVAGGRATAAQHTEARFVERVVAALEAEAGA